MQAEEVYANWGGIACAAASFVVWFGQWRAQLRDSAFAQTLKPVDSEANFGAKTPPPSPTFNRKKITARIARAVMM
jgi:hypothetical protein